MESNRGVYVSISSSNLSRGFTKSIGKKYILDEEGTVSSSLKKYLEQNPYHLGEYDTEGGWYYARPDGQSFYFDREDDNIQAVGLSGGNYKETTSELKEMLG
ncbi:hypothetical protein [Sporosarcina sp. SAFN-010]|uniref:hypothetical protein n=1 Tax=Sporosarcina sp. SAFN-010 TaxID=3387273 RepID=UPI003F7F0E54